MGDKQLWVASEANVAASLRAADGEMGRVPRADIGW